MSKDNEEALAIGAIRAEQGIVHRWLAAVLRVLLWLDPDMRKCKEEGLPQTKPHFCDLHMITILQLCLYKMGGGGDTRGTKKLQQGNETIPYSFQESCCSNVDDCVAGCGILGTGGDGSPYRAKLKLLQSLDRSELAPSTLSLSHFGPGWRIALFCIPVYRHGTACCGCRLHGTCLP